MRIRKLLLIHPNRSIRALITKYVYSELADIEITETQDGHQALNQMAPDSFDVVICSDQLKDMTLSELKSALATIFVNEPAPLIIISESESIHVRNELVEQGFDRVVQIRISPSDLIHKINALCNPRQWRKNTRYHIPGVSVTIATAHLKNQAFLINISMGGILVEMDTEHPCHLLQGAVEITLQIGATIIKGLKARILRLESIKWKPDATPSVIRATFIFEPLDDEPHNDLSELLQMAKMDKLKASIISD
jgi:CheY-like chemotaxis protein